MNLNCKQCGAALTERDAFCTKCGAPRENSTESTAARRFCTKCGAALTAETKFCAKCGAPAGVTLVTPLSTGTSGRASAEKSAATASTRATTGAAPQAVTPSTKSSGGIPKVAIVGGAIVVLLVMLVAIAGFIHAERRARQKAAAAETASDFEKNLADLAAKANAAGQNPKTQTPADINKSVGDVATAANALTALAQNANKQTGAGANNSLANSTSAPKASQNRNSRSALEDVDNVKQQVDDLAKDAPDSQTRVLNDLDNKLFQLDSALRRNPNDPKALENLNKNLADIAAAAAKLTPAILAATDAALTPPPAPSGPPMVPVAGTGDPKHDWPLEYERTVGGPEADLLVRTGDINNLGFGWPSGFDPFSGKSTPPHPWPTFNEIPPQAPPGTDRIMLGTGLTAVHMSVQHTPGKLDRIMIDSVIKTRIPGDGYSGAMNTCYVIGDLPDSILKKMTDHIQLSPNDEAFLWVSTQSAASCTRQRQLTMPVPIVLQVGKLPSKINSVVVQIFADDFQAPVYHSYFQVSLNGTRIPTFEYVINSLDQSGPIGKLVSMRLLPEYWPLLKSGTVKLLIDDPTTHVQDGYAVDFVRILVNPHKFKYEVSLTATVTDADKHTPIPGATVSVGLTSTATNQQGKCELNDIPAGLVVATANAPGYDENSVPVDLPGGQSGHADIQLHHHQETAAALEQSIAQTGTATIYGIHFDTGSSKLRADSLPALQAVLALIDSRAGSNWVISGHTDNQGSDNLNIPLSKARAASVITWLTAHGVAADRLEPQGFGATRPVADNTTANGRFLNRRVEVALAK